MEKINPAHVLVAILAACLLTVAGTLTLVLSGHREDVSSLLAVMVPVITALIAAKIDLIRRRFSSRMATAQERLDGVEQKVNGGYEALRRANASLKDQLAARPPRIAPGTDRDPGDGDAA